MKKKGDTDVVIIDIDETSLGKFGQFPWSRSVFAKIINQVETSNPKAIGFDIFFTEKDKQSPDEIIKSYGLIPSDIVDLQKLKGHDDVFADKLKGAKTITAFTKAGRLHQDFPQKFSSLASSLTTPIVLYCRTGNRTNKLGNALVSQLGYSNISHLRGGITGWFKDGLKSIPYPDQ